MGGSGKTTQLRNLLKMAYRAISYDPLGVMYPGIVINSRPELETWLDRYGENPRYKLIYRPGIDEADSEALRVEAEYICWVGRSLEHVSLFFDELDMFANVEYAGPELVVLLNQGRRHYVDVYGSVRRPQVKVPRDWWTEATVIYTYQVTDALDAGVISRKTQIDPGEFLQLPKFTYWEWRNNGSTPAKRFFNPYGGNR